MKHENELVYMAREIDEHLRVLRQLLRRPVDAEIARGHLTAPQQLVMETVVRSDGISLKDLSQRVNLSHSTVSGIVDRLEKRGFVHRKPSSQDRRFTLIVASKAVRDFLQHKLPALSVQPLLQLLERASPSEQHQILHAFRTLRKLASHSE